MVESSPRRADNLRDLEECASLGLEARDLRELYHRERLVERRLNAVDDVPQRSLRGQRHGWPTGSSDHPSE